jgi:hypothetical protein
MIVLEEQIHDGNKGDHMSLTLASFLALETDILFLHHIGRPKSHHWSLFFFSNKLGSSNDLCLPLSLSIIILTPTSFMFRS